MHGHWKLPLLVGIEMILLSFSKLYVLCKFNMLVYVRLTRIYVLKYDKVYRLRFI